MQYNWVTLWVYRGEGDSPPLKKGPNGEKDTEKVNIHTGDKLRAYREIL